MGKSFAETLISEHDALVIKAAKIAAIERIKKKLVALYDWNTSNLDTTTQQEVIKVINDELEKVKQ